MRQVADVFACPTAVAQAGLLRRYPPELARWVLGVWASIGVHAASPEDDFFGSGGHSLLAMRLVAELNSAPPAPGMGDGKRVMLEVRASNGIPGPVPATRVPGYCGVLGEGLRLEHFVA